MKIGEAPWGEVVVCDPDTSVAEVARLMERHDADGVIVMHGRGLPVGSFGRDQLAGGSVPDGVRWEDWPVGPSAVVCAFAFEPGTPVRDALRIMRRRRLSVAPVRCAGEIVATVSRRRLAAALAAKTLRARLETVAEAIRPRVEAPAVLKVAAGPRQLAAA